jgi:hypothetical protein
MGAGFPTGLMERFQRRAGKLELPAGLERDVAFVEREGDDIALLFDRLPAETLQALQ